jgi:hypothetical protein
LAGRSPQRWFIVSGVAGRTVTTRLRIDSGQSTVGEGKGGERKRHDA